MLRRISKKLFAALLVFAIVCIVVLLAVRNRKNSDQLTFRNEDVSGRILGEEGLADNSFKSENYKIPQISFGGDAITIPSGREQAALSVNDIASEVFNSKDNKTKKLLVSWKTNRIAKCRIEYMKAGSPTGKIFEEENFGFDHRALIEPLDVSTTYNFIVTARDKWNTEQASDKFAFYSGAPEISFLDLISGAFRNVFGWAIR